MQHGVTWHLSLPPPKPDITIIIIMLDTKYVVYQNQAVWKQTQTLVELSSRKGLS